jgi:type IV pilus assembly protein PilP
MNRRTCTGLVLIVAVAFAAPGVRAQAVAPEAQPVKAVEPAEDLPYDVTGRRDPFRPPRLSVPNQRTGEPQTPLQRYEIGQLRLVAVIYNTGDPRAVVEDDQGLGYIVRAGTPIGPNGGEVKTIERGRVLIQEDAVDYYGERRINEVVMELRTAERGKR